MLGKESRLKKKKEIEKVFKVGKKLVSQSILVFYLPNNLEKSRFAFSVSKKISKKAVVRNKTRRRLREITRREILPNLKISLDCLVVARKEILEKSYHELEEELRRVFKKIG